MREMKKNHPLELMNDEIERRGLVVIDNVTRMPIYNEPYVSPHLVVCLCHRGSMRGKYDMRNIEWHPHDIAAVYPNHVIVSEDTSSDFLVSLVVISVKFWEKFRTRYSFRTHFEVQMNPSFSVTDDQYYCFTNIYRTLNTISMIDAPERDEILISQIHTLALLMNFYKMQNGSKEPESVNASKQLVARFYDELVKNFRTSREVSYYADLLCLSPKYFGTVIRKETGVGAGEWISRYVITQAKTMLRSRMDLSIQQISFDLGFPNQTIFSHYFRNHTGMSPKDYRKSDAIV